jgi:hypothetical protein
MSMRYPTCRQDRTRADHVNPLHVVSRAKSFRSHVNRSISRNRKRGAATAASSGFSKTLAVDGRRWTLATHLGEAIGSVCPAGVSAGKS